MFSRVAPSELYRSSLSHFFHIAPAGVVGGEGVFRRVELVKEQRAGTSRTECSLPGQKFRRRRLFSPAGILEFTQSKVSSVICMSPLASALETTFGRKPLSHLMTA